MSALGAVPLPLELGARGSPLPLELGARGSSPAAGASLVEGVGAGAPARAAPTNRRRPLPAPYGSVGEGQDRAEILDARDGSTGGLQMGRIMGAGAAALWW